MGQSLGAWGEPTSTSGQGWRQSGPAAGVVGSVTVTGRTRHHIQGHTSGHGRGGQGAGRPQETLRTAGSWGQGDRLKDNWVYT